MNYIALYLGIALIVSGLYLAAMIRNTRGCTMAQINCCDGCQRGLPITPGGLHRTETELFVCTRARYRMELEPKSTDTWHKPQRRGDVPFEFGGGR